MVSNDLFSTARRAGFQRTESSGAGNFLVVVAQAGTAQSQSEPAARNSKCGIFLCRALPARGKRLHGTEPDVLFRRGRHCGVVALAAASQASLACRMGRGF